MYNVGMIIEQRHMDPTTFTLTLTRADFADVETFDAIAYGDDAIEYIVRPFTRNGDTLFSVAFDDYSDADTFTLDEFAAQFTAATAATLLGAIE